MNKAAPHQHGHETGAHAGHGSHKEHRKAAWIPAVLETVVFLSGGLVFLKRA